MKTTIHFHRETGLLIEREGQPRFNAKQKTVFIVLALLIVALAVVGFTLVKLTQLVGVGVLIGFAVIIFLLAAIWSISSINA